MKSLRPPEPQGLLSPPRIQDEEEMGSKLPNARQFSWFEDKNQPWLNQEPSSGQLEGVGKRTDQEWEGQVDQCADQEDSSPNQIHPPGPECPGQWEKHWEP